MALRLIAWLKNIDYIGEIQGVRDDEAQSAH